MPLLKADLPEVRAARAAGKSCRAIAEQYQVHHNTVGALLRQYAPDIACERETAPVDAEPLRLLVLDIETAPNLAYVWDVWQQNVAPSQLVQHKSVLSFASKWVGADHVDFHSRHHDGQEGMVLAAWHALNRADGVIGYNSKRFDVKHLQTEFILAGLTPPRPFQHVDLLQTAKREFQFGSNKLDAVATRLGLGHKREHEGFGLWVKTMAGDAEAWERMRLYNEQDVRLTEAVYERFLPWITNHPSWASFTGNLACTNCGSEALRSDGHRYTRTGRFPLFHCDACGHWNRGRKRTVMTEITETNSW
jgi:hypothetical protein